MPRIMPLILLAATAVLARAQSTTTGLQDIDACGTLVDGGGCVLFDGAGGPYVIPNTSGDFRFGDPVRVVGTVDPNCITICKQAKGCIRGATLYDPAVLPCGTKLPNFPNDILTNACTAASGAITAAAGAGLWFTARRRRH